MNATKSGTDLREASSDISTQIEIYGGPNNSPATNPPRIDLIDADENEIFTFESYRKLVFESRKLNKDFILARVTTADPADPSVFFNYYYSAFEVNKILFRYESNRRLLHRMKVKNPLNNMYIVGQVSYYKIPVEDIDKSIVDYYFGEVPIPPLRARRAFSAIIRDSDRIKENDYIEHRRSKDTNDIIRRNTSNQTYDSGDVEKILEGVKKGSIFVPSRNYEGCKIVHKAKYFASDDDFLLRADIREYFRNNSTEPNEDFLFELDRTNNDVMALLDNTSETENDEANGWKRILLCHMSILMSMLCVIILFGANPIVLLGALGAALVIFLSLICSMCYIMCCRRAAFDSLAVHTVDDGV